MPEDLITKFYRQRDAARATREREIKGQARYSDFGESTTPYEDTFKKLLLRLAFDFPNLLDQRSWHLGRSQLVLDLMAPPTSFLTKLAGNKWFAGGVAVTLSEEGLPRTTIFVVDRKIYTVNGDLLQGDTWSKIDEGLEKIEHPDAQFDLITCRPQKSFVTTLEGAFTQFDLPLLIPPFQKAWDRLSRQGGMIFTQLPIVTTYDTDPQSYRDILNKLPSAANALGVELEVTSRKGEGSPYEPIIRITKTETSPIDFPRRLAKIL